jgi:hypothetical protein
MASLPLALSVHNLVSSVGADAGFAAVIGLAILALLYFAHSRETVNLREEAAMLAQRLQDAEARLEAARRADPAQPARSVAPAPAAVRPRAQIPFAPAGLGAPELASATRFIPVPAAAIVGAVPAASSISVSRVAGTATTTVAPPAPPGTSEEPAAPYGSPGTSENPPPPAEPSVPAPVGVPPGQATPQPPIQPPARPPVPAPAAVTAFRTAPATVAGAAGPARPPDEAPNGSSSAPVGVIDEPAPAVPVPQPSQAPPGDRTVGARQAPIFPPDRNVFVSTRTRHGSPIGRRFAVLVGLLVVVGAVAAVVIATSGTGSQNPSSAPGAGGTPATPAFNPALITVAVLNGTNTNQLAHHVADRLAALGYKEGSIATASNQTLTSTIVGYQTGAANRTAALHIARTLKLPPRSVGPVDQAARTVACPPPSACTANVIVTVGANLAAGY